MIRVYGNASPNVVKVVLMLEELGLAYEQAWVDQWTDQQFSPAFIALNPNSKVPAMVDEDAGVTVFESGAILIYLAEKAGAFLPTLEPDRSRVMSWLMLQMSGIGPTFGNFNHFNNFDYTDEEVPYAKRRFGNEARRLVGVLDRRLGEATYLGGADYSIADIATYPWASLFDPIGVSTESAPHLRAWLERVGDRPAARRTMSAWDKAKVRTGADRAGASPQVRDRYFGRVPRSR